jgi:hypothetical protein
MKPGYLLLLTAVSMSLGWRIRGQFGHEIGAAMAGALVGLGLVIGAGRMDWYRKATFFAGFAALGWSFGGSMSYMKVVSFCHSSDPATVVYGFACLFVVGLMWAAPGGAAVAMAAVLDLQKLHSLTVAAVCVFSVWFSQDIIVDLLESRSIKTDWYGSDWLAASTALVGALLTAVVRKKIDFGVSLVVHMAVGWWAAFAGLVVLADLHMNPPRGDNWAGCLGLTLGLWVFLWRHRMSDVLRASLVTGFLGGAGFAIAQLLKLVLLRLQWLQDPHPIMEWLHGGFFGVAIAIAMLPLMRTTARQSDDSIPLAMQVVALLWLLWIIPYYNFRKCADQWIQAMPNLKEPFQGLHLAGKLVPSSGWIGWIEVIFLAWLVAFLLVFWRQRSAPSPLLDIGARGRTLMLFISLVACFAFASFSRDLTNLEGGNELPIQVVITLHALGCIVLALWPGRQEWVAPPEPSRPISFSRLIVSGLLVAVLTITLGSVGKEAMFYRAFAGGFYMNHIRFGPDNTNDQK